MIMLYAMNMRVKIELEREDDGRWIADIPSMGGLLYGKTRADAVTKATVLTFEVLAGAIKAGEMRAPRSVAFEVVAATTRKRSTKRR